MLTSPNHGCGKQLLDGGRVAGAGATLGAERVGGNGRCEKIRVVRAAADVLGGSKKTCSQSTNLMEEGGRG